MSLFSFTPREVVSELDRYIVGQAKAKRAVAIALRNRFRRQRVSDDMRDEIIPKNILMIGPTGVGKTEIARRLAKLAQAPFVKVEASKFTEVGYVGRDVESMVRDLVENAIQLVRSELMEEVRAKAELSAEERLIRLLSGRPSRKEPPSPAGMFPFFTQGKTPEPEPELPASQVAELRAKLRAGELDERTVEVELEPSESGMPLINVLGGQAGDDLQKSLKDMFGGLSGMRGRGKRRSVKVPEARRILERQEAERLVDTDRVHELAVKRAEQSGIIFLDEIDKVASRQGGVAGPDISREGVQRDLLPIVEGSTVNTKYGPVKTDHVLFVAAGAFHVAQVSDLIPELQGRFPVRVELEPLGQADFVRILTEPKHALVRQYTALLATEGVQLSFTAEAVDAIADIATQANARAENIGARRLHTIMEAVLDDISFRASELSDKTVEISADDVRKALKPILDDEDLSRYIL